MGDPRTEGLRGIGRMSRESGLTVSALRFYDGAGLLSPAHVDSHTAYRYYAPDQLAVARLIAVLRRAGMPLTGIRFVLAHGADLAAVDAVLGEHVGRLERGLADARRALATVPALIASREGPVPATVLSLPAAELVSALRAVRFAAGADPALPVLAGVLFDVDAEGLTLVATDRYRLAVAPVPEPARQGPETAAVAPVTLVDALLDGLREVGGSVTMTLAADRISVWTGTVEIAGPRLPDAFPDYRRLLPAPDHPATAVDPDALRSAVAAAPARTSAREQDGVEFAVALLGIVADGGVAVTDAGDPGAVGVNREFLLEAVDAGGDGQLLLSLDGPARPLVLRSAGSVSLLMPVRA
jgi:DNA polymerase III subunit beta